MNVNLNFLKVVKKFTANKSKHLTYRIAFQSKVHFIFIFHFATQDQTCKFKSNLFHYNSQTKRNNIKIIVG